MLPFPMFRPRPVHLTPPVDALHWHGSPPTSSPVFRSAYSPVCQCFSATLGCSLTEQKKSKPGASNPFVLLKIQRPFLQPLSIHTLANSGGGYFSPLLFLRRSSPILISRPRL